MWKNSASVKNRLVHSPLMMDVLSIGRNELNVKVDPIQVDVFEN